MSRNQMLLQSMFEGQAYQERNGFEVRPWQLECYQSYKAFLAFREGAPQRCFCIYAGTASGKTKASAILACHLLNLHSVDQVVIVCPNRSIRRKTQRDFVHFFGIELATFHAKKHQDGIPRIKQGYILTYAHLMQDPTLHRRICSVSPTLVIFDEVHHLGDSSDWGSSAIEAFGKVPFIISLTGTPWRSDNTRIPFVKYEPSENGDIAKFKPDYTYDLGRAVREDVCRKPLYVTHGGTVRIRPQQDAGELTVTFDDTNVTEAISSLRLRGAVRYGAETRRAMLRESLQRCRLENRKTIIFLGGDTEGDQTPTEDAWNFLPSELKDIGYSEADYEVVTGDDSEAQTKIEHFGKSSKWILISVNMISEGTDIPEVSACIFLTSITAKQTTIQRIGRALRLMGPDDPHKDALIFLFRDPDLLSLTAELEKEVEDEVNLSPKHSRQSESEGENSEHRRRAEAIGIAGGTAETVRFNGQEWPIEIIEKARSEIKMTGLPMTMLNSVLKLMMESSNVNAASI